MIVPSFQELWFWKEKQAHDLSVLEKVFTVTEKLRGQLNLKRRQCFCL